MTNPCPVVRTRYAMLLCLEALEARLDAGTFNISIEGGDVNLMLKSILDTPRYGEMVGVLDKAQALLERVAIVREKHNARLR